MSMGIRRWLWGGAAVASILALALLAWACGDEGDFLLGEEPTETPITSPTPGATATPIGPTPTATPEVSPTPEGATPTVDVTPVEPFEITVKEAVNVRAAPSTNADILGGFYPGHRRTVIGEARGEEVEPGLGDLWYALDEGGFVYAPFVQKVEE